MTQSSAVQPAGRTAEIRNKEIGTHLNRMEEQLEQTRATVAGLRALLEAPAGRQPVEFRAVPATTALAVRGMVTVAGFVPWWLSAFDDCTRRWTGPGSFPPARAARSTGRAVPGGAGVVTAFVPVPSAPAALPGPAGPAVLEIPAVEAAVMLHQGPMDDLDRTYGALGTIVAERAIGVEGPIREYYLVGFRDTEDQARHRTEVCWPVFRTPGQQPGSG